MWESTGQLDRAIQVYDIGFQPIAHALEQYKGGGGGGPGANYEQVKRGAGLALKLGDLWVTSGASDPRMDGEAQSEAERYYSWAVGELMRLSLTPEQKLKVSEQMDAQEKGVPVAQEVKTDGGIKKEEEKGMELPSWIGEVELVAAFERLGDLYSRQGKIE